MRQRHYSLQQPTAPKAEHETDLEPHPEMGCGSCFGQCK
ncbi:hypothetical protein CAter282_2106 [Collimonas arenae]|uniref:Uncharacterized protein n=1 Tax=Collimonas arenae TaxID=279058 RepID=A0A127QIM8_9BURK|nr:hypothetical protein CAter10_2288 [Collimonas arenae]AMP09864.1 hypothetical protein CAter282_2106 [Collimonas arenae]